MKFLELLIGQPAKLTPSRNPIKPGVIFTDPYKIANSLPGRFEILGDTLPTQVNYKAEKIPLAIDVATPGERTVIKYVTVKSLDIQLSHDEFSLSATISENGHDSHTFWYSYDRRKQYVVAHSTHPNYPEGKTPTQLLQYIASGILSNNYQELVAHIAAQPIELDFDVVLDCFRQLLEHEANSTTTAFQYIIDDFDADITGKQISFIDKRFVFGKSQKGGRETANTLKRPATYYVHYAARAENGQTTVSRMFIKPDGQLESDQYETSLEQSTMHKADITSNDARFLEHINEALTTIEDAFKPEPAAAKLPAVATGLNLKQA